MKYGFVYMWRDRGKDRYYIGGHWGTQDDGYICSSTWMRNSRSRRPQDFRRRILSRHNTKDELWEAEYQWLKLIPDEELGHHYYNTHKEKYQVGSPFKGKTFSHTEDAKSRISKNHSRHNKGQKLSKEHCEKLSKSHLGQVAWNKGKKMPKEFGESISQKMMGKKRGKYDV